MRFLLAATAASVLLLSSSLAQQYDNEYGNDYADYQEYASDYAKEDNLYHDYAQRQETKR